MTKSTSLKVALCKQFALVPLSVAAIFMFSSRTIAQNTKDSVKPKQKEIQSKEEGVPLERLNEYEAIVNKYKLTEYVHATPPAAILDADKNRLETIFFAMSKAQQAKQTVTFITPAPPPRSKPTDEQFKSFKNSKMYALTIDDKNVDNTALNNYQPSDFWHFSIVYLAKTNSNYGKHLPLKVFLMTKEKYKDSIKKASDANQDNIMITRSVKKAIQK